MKTQNPEATYDYSWVDLQIVNDAGEKLATWTARLKSGT